MNPPPAPTKRVNVRRPDIMERVQSEVESHYSSPLVQRIRSEGGILRVGETTIRLAREFGFCYGVQRAIDLAYAARRVFPNQRMFLIGEIIHNPEVNRQLVDMGIISLPWQAMDEQYDDLGPDDVVIVPAFGAPLSFMDKIDSRGCAIVDTTCGDVMKVWRRVRQYAKEGITSIIHGKKTHEETRATASRALGDKGQGHYLIVLDHAEVERVCQFIRIGGDPTEFLLNFEGAFSPGFDPVEHLKRVGVANQTTMLKSETEAIQERIRGAIIDRDGSPGNFQVFDTICGATQDRQDALFLLLKEPMDALVVVGGYNSSNTTHLVEIGSETTPTFFIRNAECLINMESIIQFDIHQKKEVASSSAVLVQPGPVNIGITAGASCPDNLIEATILRLLHLRGFPADAISTSQSTDSP